MDFVSSTGFLGSFSFSCLLTLDLDNFHFIQVDSVADGGFLADRTNGRAYATVLRLSSSVVVVCDVMYCG